MAKFKYYNGSQWVELAAKSDLSGFLTNAIVSASVSGNTLTLTPASGSAVTFTPTMSGNYLPLSGGTITGDNAIYFGDSNYYIKRTDEGGSNYTLELGAPSLHITSSWEAEVAIDFKNGNSTYSIEIVGDADDNAFWVDSDKDIMFRDTVYYGNSKIASNEIATHGWVNTQLSGYLPLSGGTLSGALYFGDTQHRISQEDGTYLTRYNDGTISLPNSSGKGMAILTDEGNDYGLLYVGSDGAILANSGDTGYVFRVFDKDAQIDILQVCQNGGTSVFNSDLSVAGSFSTGSSITEAGTLLSNKYQAKGNYAGTAVATTSTNGLMSSTDKTALDGIVASLNNDDSDSVVNRLKDVLSVFQDYPEGTTILSALNSKLSLSGGDMTGHIYMTGATTSSTGNTTQIVFGTANSQSVAVSSNPGGLIINPSTSSTTGQINLWVGSNPRIEVDGYNVITAATIGSQSVNYANSAGSAPASDVYPWAKEATKPSYNYSEIGAGNIIQGNATGYYSYRQGSGVRAGFYYHSAGDESTVFCNEYEGAGWIFANGYIPEDKVNWQNITPTLQIKRGGVAIGKLIGQSQSPAYNLDVNGTANATTVTVATKMTMQYNSNEDCIEFVFA